MLAIHRRRAEFRKPDRRHIIDVAYSPGAPIDSVILDQGKSQLIALAAKKNVLASAALPDRLVTAR